MLQRNLMPNLLRRAGIAALLLAMACSGDENVTGPGGGNNQPPNVDVMASTDASMGETVTLDASGSTDPEGDNLTYTWTQSSGPSVGALSGATPTFTAPDEVTTLAFELVVSDGTTESDPVALAVYVLENKDRALFVDVSAGSDGNDGSRTAPFASVVAAIAAAASDGSDVYLTAGTYAESVELQSGVSIYGGYESGSWLRDPEVHLTDIMGGPTAVSGNGVSDLTLEGLGITAGDATDAGPPSSVAVQLVASTGIRILNNRIAAGLGLPGADGVAAVGRAIAGSDGGRGDREGSCVPANDGGSGGASPRWRGGTGGRGGSLGGLRGSGGQGPGGGSGGAGGALSVTRINPGRPGGDGDDGSPGSDGSGGAAFGSLSNGLYVGSDGANGGNGSAGSGGGGGGGGMGQTFVCGAGGGGGGGGGVGGAGGDAGEGGGASLGIVLANGSDAEIVGNSISTADGGAGGSSASGRLGGLSGGGGSGGTGGGGSFDGGAGGDGGDGGTGGRGGYGGGGGGGPSIGILEDAGSSSQRTGNTFAQGSGGTGGTSTGNAGDDGVSAEYDKIT